MSVFYNKILNWAKKGDSLVTANGNNLICLVHKNIKDDEEEMSYSEAKSEIESTGFTCE